MLFNMKDVQQFLSQKDFIDTALVPLLSIDLSEEAVQQSSTSADFLVTLSNFVEQQFRGRIFLFPPFSYFSKTKDENFVQTLKKELLEFGFKHVVFITSDNYWTSFKEEFNIIWLPSIPLESMDQQVKNTVLNEQLKHIVPILTSVWSQSK